MLIGLLLLILIGIAWTASGVVMSGVGRNQLSTDLLQFVMYTIGVIVFGGMIVSGLTPKVTVSGGLLWYASAAYLGVGIMNYILNTLMCQAMARGPNSLVWAILQSGMVIPFLVGVCFHHVPAGWLRLLGMCLLLISLFLMSRKQEEEKKVIQGKSWLVLSFLAFLVCGFQQSLCNEPSYVEELRTGFHATYRAFFIELASSLSAVFALLFKGREALQSTMRFNVPKRSFWGYALGLESITIIFSIFITYPTYDYMAKLGMGAITYPVAVVTCIAGFTIYSLVALREKLTISALLGLISCVTGIVLISLQ